MSRSDEFMEDMRSSRDGYNLASRWKKNWIFRTDDSRGFAFVRYKYAGEAQKAVDRLDGRVVDSREITIQFAKYGPNTEKMELYFGLFSD